MDAQTTPRSTAIIAAVVIVVLMGPLTVVLLGVGLFVASTAEASTSCTGGSGTTLAATGATTGAQVGDLTPAQMDSAAIIVAVGEQLQVPDRGIVVALSVAHQESRFQNYANDGTDPRLRPEQRDVVLSLGYPHDAVGRNHGSVNAFQQQFPTWGTVAELMNPPTAARKFYEALLRIPGWEQMPVTVAAQRVQQSQFPDAYADDEALARQLHTRLAGAGALLASAPCTSGSGTRCPATELPVEDGLTPDALRVLRCVQQNFGDHTYLGVGGRRNNPTSDHPAGRAVDTMIAGWDTPTGRTHGTAVATWVTEHAAALGVTYVIWNARIWTADNPEAGWAPYTHSSGGGGPTLEHRDHVHVSVHGNTGTDTGTDTGSVSAAGWSLPLDPGAYVLTSGYGPRVSPTGGAGTFHAGLDFAAPTGTTIRAAADGVVTYAGFNQGGFGNLVIIATAPNVLTYYAHQSSLAVATGAQVTAGQVIGAVGTTGDSTGPHLHFEVRIDGKTTDPLPYLRQQGLDPGSLGGRS